MSVSLQLFMPTVYRFEHNPESDCQMHGLFLFEELVKKCITKRRLIEYHDQTMT